MSAERIEEMDQEKMAENVARLYQERRDKFIATRTVIESEVNKFLQSLEKLDPDIRERCSVKEGITAKDLLSELWVEPFDMARYQEQLKNFTAYKEGVFAICDEINAEALRCLQQ